MSNATAADGGVRKGRLGQRIAYACGNLGQSAFYNAMSTYFVVYVTSCLFSGVDKALAAKLIGVITSLVVIIRIAEIFIDPLLGNIVDNTTTKWGRFRPWQFIGGAVSAVLLAIVFSGMFGLVNVNTTLFIVLFVITFVVLDVFYSLRDISYWGMIPALSSDSHERSTYTSLGSFTGSIGYNGITIVVIPIVTYFSYMFTGKQAESQSGWTAFGIIVMLLGIITAWTVAFGTKESTSALRSKAQKNGNPLEAFKALFQNDQLLWVALSYLLYAIANVATTGVLLFLFKFVLDNSAAYSATGRHRTGGRSHHGSAVPDSEQAHPTPLPVHQRHDLHDCRLRSAGSFLHQHRRGVHRTGALLRAGHAHPDDRHPLPDRLH